VLQEM